jgi:hypothetical protein
VRSWETFNRRPPRHRGRSRRPRSLATLSDTETPEITLRVSSLGEQSSLEMPPTAPQGVIPYSEAVIACSSAADITRFAVMLPSTSQVVDGVSTVWARRVFHTPFKPRPQPTQLAQKSSGTHLRMFPQTTHGIFDRRIQLAKLTHG